MKRTILLLAVMTVLTSGCSDHVPPITAMNQKCAVAAPIGNCPAKAKRNKISIHFNKSGIPKVTPQNMCADAKADIEVTITPANNEVLVYTVPENVNDRWILASNQSDRRRMTISVPESAKGKDFKYFIFASNGQCIDPRMRVD